MGGLWSTKVTNSCFHFISPRGRVAELHLFIYHNWPNFRYFLCVCLVYKTLPLAKTTPLGLFAVKVFWDFRRPKSQRNSLIFYFKLCVFLFSTSNPKRQMYWILRHTSIIEFRSAPSTLKSFGAVNKTKKCSCQLTAVVSLRKLS